MDFIDFILDPRENIINVIIENFERIFTFGIGNEGLQESLLQMPSSFSPETWSMVQGVADRVMVPIAAIILTYVMCMELIEWAQDQNIMHNSAAVISKLLWFVVKLGIGVLLVQRAGEITLGAFDLGVYIANNSMININTGGGISVSLQNLHNELQTMDFLNLLGMLVVSTLGMGVMKIIGIFIHSIVIIRIVTIYIYCSVGSVPYATLMHKTFSNIGQNYIKNLFALAFQGLFLILALAVYPLMIATLVSQGDAFAALGNMLIVSLAECIIVWQSKNIAKSIFTAQ